MRNEPFGAAFRLYTLENAAGTRLSVTDAGASVVSLLYRGVDIALGWDSPEDYGKNELYLGATVGRCANRLRDARFTLNGREYILRKNDGEHSLHSGPEGWERRTWALWEASETAVVFYLDSPDGDQGYPGRVRLWASYALTDEDEIRLAYRAEAEADTLLNVTNHCYFNLNGHAAGDVGGHWLCLAASAYTPIGEDMLPTGELRSAEGGPFDLRPGRVLGAAMTEKDPQLRLAGGFDHNFCLDGRGLRAAARLRGERSGIVLTLLTDRPGVQLYTGNFLGGQRGKDGVVYGRRAGVCLETQCWPDAVHHPHFPSPILRAGESFRSETRWRLSRSRRGALDKIPASW